jgi:stage II sporulation protein AA (anti-sigma F factor antagonist)
MSASEFDSRFFLLERRDDVALATFVPAKLTDEDNVERLGQDLSALVDKLQHRRVILDVGSVNYVTSSVVGKWIMLHRKLDREGGKLVLCGIRPSLADILGAAKLMTYFAVADDPQAARAALDAPQRSQRDASA